MYHERTNFELSLNISPIHVDYVVLYFLPVKSLKTPNLLRDRITFVAHFSDKFKNKQFRHKVIFPSAYVLSSYPLEGMSQKRES